MTFGDDHRYVFNSHALCQELSQYFFSFLQMLVTVITYDYIVSFSISAICLLCALMYKFITVLYGVFIVSYNKVLYQLKTRRKIWICLFIYINAITSPLFMLVKIIV